MSITHNHSWKAQDKLAIYVLPVTRIVKQNEGLQTESSASEHILLCKVGFVRVGMFGDVSIRIYNLDPNQFIYFGYKNLKSLLLLLQVLLLLLLLISHTAGTDSILVVLWIAWGDWEASLCCHLCLQSVLRDPFLSLPVPRVKEFVVVVVRLWRPLPFPPSICSTVE